MSKSSGWKWVGCISIAAGFLALFSPFVASLTAVYVAGWMFMVVGVVQLFTAFQKAKWGGKLLALLWAELVILCGGTLLWHPLQGLVALTWIIGFSLVCVGLLKIVLAFRARPIKEWRFMLLSALLSVIFGLLILGNLQTASPSVLGYLLGFELIQSGISLMMLGKIQEFLSRRVIR